MWSIISTGAPSLTNATTSIVKMPTSFHLISAAESVASAAEGASTSEERSRAVSGKSWGASVKASAVNSHYYKRQIVRYESSRDHSVTKHAVTMSSY